MKQSVAFLFAVVVCLAFQSSLCAYADEKYQSIFTTWMHTYSKTYSAEEFDQRFEIFKSNVDFVEAHNALPTKTHTGVLQKHLQ